MAMRQPLHRELKEQEGNYILLAPNTPTWDTLSTIYKDQEYGMTDYNRNIKDSCQCKLDKSILDPDEQCAVDDNLISAVKILGESVSAVKSSHRKGRVDAQTLSRRLNIPLEMAKKTIQSTTQLAVRMVNEPSLMRKFSTNDGML